MINRSQRVNALYLRQAGQHRLSLGIPQHGTIDVVYNEKQMRSALGQLCAYQVYDIANVRWDVAAF